MALSASSMKKDIIDAMESKKPDTAAAANKVFGDAILENICDNISITYAWAAVLPPPASTSDPQVSFSATVSGAGTLAPSSTFPEMLIKLATLIKGLTISAPTGFAVAPLAFNPAGVLVAVMANEDNQDLAMTNFCTQIIASIKTSFINPTPAAGTHGTYSGATTGMVIT
jgi:hypothetical protein